MMLEDVQQGISRYQRTLLGMGLMYLAVPNLLFLAGWFTPVVAITGWVLIAIGVICTIRELNRQARTPDQEEKVSRWFAPALLAVSACVTLYFLTCGIVGMLPTHGDYQTLRQALFCNLRDDGWPLILPNGREMSYYLAQMLPPAMLARLLPQAWGQWCIVLWSIIPILLAIALLSTLPLGGGRTKKLFTVALALFLVRDPFAGITTRGIYHFCDFFQIDPGGILAVRGRVVAVNPLKTCIGAYNAVPSALLAGAMIWVGAKAWRYMIPLVLGLVAAISPLSGPALAALAIFFYLRGVRREGFPPPRCLLLTIPPPLVMASLAAVYFLRADGDARVSTSLQAFGWVEQLLYTGKSLLAFSLLLLPLWKLRKRDKFYLLMCAYLLFGSFLFIGTYPDETYSGMNEHWLKSAPVFTMVLAIYWLADWRKISRIKYLVLPLCLLTVADELKSCVNLDFSRYLQVADDWNGHLNHDAPFLRQSIPPCKEPLVPGLLLRESGEAARYFPGCIFPVAPGCDYSRPAANDIDQNCQ